jgi:general secretion pathway protein C
MVALKNVADMPFLANAGDALEHVGAILKKVPTKNWRLGITAIALFWLCHSFANLFWYVVPAPELPMAPVMPAVATEENDSGVSIDIAAVQARNMFGVFNAQPIQPVVVEAPPLDVTALNLELGGVVVADDPALSWAFIGNAATQKLYRIGEEVEGAPGVKVAEIYDIKVVLNNNGKLEELYLYGRDGVQLGVAVQDAAPIAPQPIQPVMPVPEVQTTVSRDQIEQARNIGDVVRFMVATEDGKMIGYKVRPGRQRELFDQVGLKADDIVISVNGIEVNEPQKVREVYQALRNATEADLQVMRDGSTHSIQITMSSER